MTALLLLAGLALLIAGAESLVRGAARLASALGLPSLVIGLTVVAFGTSAPELAVSLQAGLSGAPDLALANVTGSNIFNICAILGCSALLAPLAVSGTLIRRDVPLMIAASLLVFVLAADGSLGPWEGVLFLALLAAYTTLQVVQGRREGGDPGPPPPPGLGVPIVLSAAGLGLLVLGSRWLVAGASELGRALGVEERVIGLTIVAAGTSLPELATSLVAALRGQRDIAVGNVVGSNIFNLLAILGAAAAASGGLPIAPAALALDLPVMLLVTFPCLPFFFTGRIVSRREGALFLAMFLAYMAYLVCAAKAPAAAEPWRWPLFGLLLLLLSVAGLVPSSRRAR